MLPQIVTSLKHYSKEQFFKDLTAGVIVGIVALPLAIAFAMENLSEYDFAQRIMGTVI